MQAYKIVISNYDTGRVGLDGDGKKEPIIYAVVSSLVNILLNPRLGLAPAAYLESVDLADKIREAEVKGDASVLLDAKEFGILKTALNGLPGQTQAGKVGFGPDDAELVRRVLRAEEVEVAEPIKLPHGGTPRDAPGRRG